MKDRFAAAGILALALALLSSVWLFQSQAAVPAQPAQTLPQSGVESAATPEAPLPERVVPDNSVDLVVALDGVGGAGAFARAGDHVDLLAFIPGELNAGNATTRVMLHDVHVRQRSGDAVVTLAVSPDQALFVRSAQSLGVRLFAELRPADGSIADHPADVVSDADIRARLLSGSR